MSSVSVSQIAIFHSPWVDDSRSQPKDPLAAPLDYGTSFHTTLPHHYMERFGHNGWSTGKRSTTPGHYSNAKETLTPKTPTEINSDTTSV